MVICWPFATVCYGGRHSFDSYLIGCWGGLLLLAGQHPLLDWWWLADIVDLRFIARYYRQFRHSGQAERLLALLTLVIGVKKWVEILVNCLMDRPFWVWEVVEKTFVRGDLMGVEEDGSDGREFVGTLLVVDECVIVEGVDDVGDGEDFQRVIQLGWWPQVPGALGANECRQGMDELLLSIDGLQLQQGVLGQHMEVKWYCRTINQTYQQSAKPLYLQFTYLRALANMKMVKCFLCSRIWTILCPFEDSVINFLYESFKVTWWRTWAWILGWSLRLWSAWQIYRTQLCCKRRFCSGISLTPFSVSQQSQRSYCRTTSS